MKRLTAPVVLLALGAYYSCMVWLIFFPPQISGTLTGATAEAKATYGFWSGFGGTLLFSALVLFPPWYYQHSCHHNIMCLRWGRYPVAGGLAKVCRKHHPDIDESRPIHEELRRLHLEWKKNGSSPAS